MDCHHDLSEREVACADGMCPICLRAQLAARDTLLTDIAREFDTWDDSEALGYSDLIALTLSWRTRIAAAGLAEGRA